MVWRKRTWTHTARWSVLYLSKLCASSIFPKRCRWLSVRRLCEQRARFRSVRRLRFGCRCATISRCNSFGKDARYEAGYIVAVSLVVGVVGETVPLRAATVWHWRREWDSRMSATAVIYTVSPAVLFGAQLSDKDAPSTSGFPPRQTISELSTKFLLLMFTSDPGLKSGILEIFQNFKATSQW